MPKLRIQNNVNQPLGVGGLVGVLNPTQVKVIEATVQDLEALRVPLSNLAKAGLITISAIHTEDDPFDDHAEGVVFSQLPAITGDPSATYVTTSSSALLPNEKVLTAGDFITITPAASTVTLALAHHASSHTSVGADPLGTASTIPTNNSSTANTSVTDPNHTHSLSATTANNNSITLTGWYALNSTEADGIVLGTISQTVASVAATSQPGVPRTINVAFPGGWLGGTITVNGTGRNGAVISEIYTYPGSAGTVVGVKAFFSLTSFANSTQNGGIVNAQILLGHAYGVPHDTVVTFLKVSIDGSATTFSISDTANGTFDPLGAHHGNHGIDVWYTYTLNLTQASHTHSVGSSATGITVSDSGHNHTQNSHSHSIV